MLDPIGLPRADGTARPYDAKRRSCQAIVFLLSISTSILSPVPFSRHSCHPAFRCLAPLWPPQTLHPPPEASTLPALPLY